MRRIRLLAVLLVVGLGTSILPLFEITVVSKAVAQEADPAPAEEAPAPAEDGDVTPPEPSKPTAEAAAEVAPDTPETSEPTAEAAAEVAPDTPETSEPTAEAAAEVAPESEPIPPYAETEGFQEPVGVVDADLLNLREGPGVHFASLGQYPKSAKVTILARHSDWLQVLTGDGKTGWMIAQYMLFDAAKVAELPAPADVPVATDILTGTLLLDAAYVYANPDETYERVGTLVVSDTIELLVTWNGWFRVRNQSAVEGWLPTSQISATETTLQRVPVSRHIGNNAVALAWNYVGYPYVWGGSSPSVGFDCSGLVRYVYGQMGLWLPHSAAAQFSAAYGTPIYAMDQLQPGDIVFFANTYMWGISHVGIYAGDGQIIQALTPGIGVGVSSIYESYWYWRFAGAIRP